MPYCTHCGKELSGEEQFCPNCGEPTSSKTTIQPPITSTPSSTPYRRPREGTVLATWGDRFIAWLIDVIIIGVVAEILQLPSFKIMNIPFISFGSRDLILYVYWTIVEGFYGQAIGKMAMRLKLTRLDSSPATLYEAAIGSFGKAFILPIDCIIGWIAESCKENRQRLFSMLASTIVIKK